LSRKSERKKLLEEYRRKLAEAYNGGVVVDVTDRCSGIMPKAEEAREVLHRVLSLCGLKDEREFRVYLVENIEWV